MSESVADVLNGLMEMLYREGTPMKLLTNEFRDACPPLYSNEDVPLKEKKVVAKFFTPDSNWTWYVTEGQPEAGDFMCFGYVQGFEAEWGYFMMGELESSKGPLGLPIERDTSVGYNQKKLGELVPDL